MGMFPPHWGYAFWYWIHSCAWARVERYGLEGQIPVEEAEHLRGFMRHLCVHLPCFWCTHHCGRYTQENPPKCETAGDFWRYTVDFHNAVNKRTGKLQLSYQEAQRALLTTSQTRDVTRDVTAAATEETEAGELMSEVMMHDWWTALMVTSKFIIHRQPGQADEYTPEQQAVYRRFLVHACHAMPFSSRPIEVEVEVEAAEPGADKNEPEVEAAAPRLVELEDRPAGRVMAELAEVGELASSKAALATICRLYNAVAPKFGVAPAPEDKLEADMNAMFFSTKTMLDVSRAHDMRVEDHMRMLALQEEMHQQRSAGAATVTLGAGSKERDYKVATVVLASVLGITLLAMVYHWARVHQLWPAARLAAAASSAIRHPAATPVPIR